MPEVWNSLKSVYEEAVNRPDCKVYIVTHPRYLYSPTNNTMMDFLKMQNIEAINAYEDGKWFDIRTLSPDYVFYTRPYASEYYRAYKPQNVKKYAKLCYIPYGYTIDLDHIFGVCFNSDFISNMSYVFHSNQISSTINKKRFSFANKMKITEFLYHGFPRFDLMKDDDINQKEIKKYRNFLWIPRFPVSVEQRNIGGHFQDYFHTLYDCFEKNEDINLIIRPHPLMFQRYLELGLMTKTEISKLKEQVDQALNIKWDTKKDYMVEMRNADVLIADFSSIIVEFAVMNKPLIYCDTVTKDNMEFYEFSKAAFYFISNEQELVAQLKNLLEENDSKALERKRYLKKMGFITEEKSATRILNYLLSK